MEIGEIYYVFMGDLTLVTGHGVKSIDLPLAHTKYLEVCALLTLKLQCSDYGCYNISNEKLIY